VVGYATLSDNTTLHAFLWTEGDGMQDLGTLPGDVTTFGFGINEKGQVVGSSVDASDNFRAFFWQSGVMTDLNTLIPTSSPLFLLDAFTINSRGEIIGDGFQVSTGEVHAYLAVPINSEATSESASPATRGETSQSPRVVLPENVRKMFQQRLGFGRFMRGPQVPSGKTAVTSAPTATLSPTSLIFSTRAIGTTSAAKTVALKNTGTASLTISSIAITGTNAGNFAQTHTCGSSLAAGASCSISVTFKPTASGTRTAALNITDNATGSPPKVSLTGIGTTAKLSPPSLNFGTVAISTTSPAKTVTLTNIATTTLTISGIAIGGTSAGDFAQTHSCGSSLAAGASCTISVTFKPTASGTRGAALNVSDNAAGSPQKVWLSGIGTTAKVSPTSLSFGSVAFGATSSSQTVTLTNVGTSSLSITGIAITGTDPGDFAQTQTCGSSLATGASCSINVTFKPTELGTRTAALSVSDNAAGSPRRVSLSGTGVAGRCTPVGGTCNPYFPCCPGLHCVGTDVRPYCG
jgi:probable HAF family extracellular repeat protein